MSRAWRARAALLTLVGTLLVHESRYALFPRHHEDDLAEVHRYLSWLIPVVGALLFLAAVQLAMRLRRPGTGAVPELPGPRTLWLISTTGLLASFGLQETVESLVTIGALPGTEVLVHGGAWVVLPLAVAVGGVLALLLRGAAGVVEWALARRTRAHARRPDDRLSVPSSRPARGSRAAVIARHLAGRAPPLLFV